MKLIIDIPEDMWERVQDGYVPLGISKFLTQGKPYEECKTAYWIRQETPYGYANSYECSECGRVIWNDEGEEGLDDFPYCHCGCRMIAREEKKNDDM